MEVANSNFSPAQLKSFDPAILKTQFACFNGMANEIITSFTEEQLFQLAYSEVAPDTAIATKLNLDDLRTTKATMECYIEDTNVVINISSYAKGGKPSGVEEVLDDYIEWCQNNGVKGEYYRTGVENALRSIKRSVYKEIVNQTWESLQGKPNEDVVNQFLSDFQFSDAEQIAIKWWMSDTKRRLRDVATKSTVDISAQVPYPVFYGGQGVGKTYICRELRKPFGELGATDKVSSMMDEFNQKKYGKMLISDLDDISKVADRDLANLKNFATTDVLNPRKMRSEEQHYIKKITTVICSSNDPIHEVVPDTTGARRFFQIDVPTTGYLEPIRKTDFVALWQAVDIDWSPNTEEHNLILDSQSDQRKRDVVEVWWEDKYEHHSFGKSIQAVYLFENFDNWREHSKHMQVTQTTFGNKVAKFLSDKLEKKRTNSGMVYVRLTPEPEGKTKPGPELEFDSVDSCGYTV